MSFLKNFNFKSLGHYIAVAARDIVKFGPVAQKDIALASSVVEAVDPKLAPAVEEINRAATTALGYVADAATKVTALADGTNTLTIQGLTGAEVQDYQALAAYFKNHAYANGISLPGVTPPAAVAKAS